MPWIKRWNMWIATEPTLPGVWLHKDSGVLVRAHAKDPKSGKLVEIKKYLPDATPRQGLAWLEIEREKVRRERRSQAPSKTHFHEYAAQLFERKVKAGDIDSSSGREKWRYALPGILRAPWATYYVDRIRHADMAEWRDSLPGTTWERRRRKKNKDGSWTTTDEVYASGEYDTTTFNTWLSVLSTISAQMTREFELPRDPFLGIRVFPEDPAYGPDAPNALNPEENEVADFLDKMKELYPQHYAIAFLGLAIGHRPSTLRPLRRKGPKPDLIFKEDGTARLYVRRSHTDGGQEVTERIKTREPITIDLPREVAAVLREQIVELEKNPITRASDLLFPSTRTGKLQSKTGLAKAFETVRKKLGLPKLTPKAMRRTWKDVARTAGVEAVVRKAVSGTKTDAMEERYSTPRAGEKQTAVSKVVSINTARAKKKTGAA